MNRQKTLLVFVLLSFSITVSSQAPSSAGAGESILRMKKLNVLGSVLYIAAHPDDENTRLLAWLANEKLYRTGYLSLTRGDGGQNLIGDEQGVDLGLIRTQELLAARRIDGAEQFFSTAYDFGFCKTPEEALQTWGHEKILSDVVWVIRKFRPDVIIARFPEDARAGHGHHAASGILAREAFDAAADPNRFPEHFSHGVSPWQAKRLLWNTFNFGGNNTQDESQFKVDVGMYNPLLGKSYGEIAALSRSQHKSQGFGVPSQRGSSFEYFVTVKGTPPSGSLMDGVDDTWKRLTPAAGRQSPTPGSEIASAVNAILHDFNADKPQLSVPSLVRLYSKLTAISDEYWRRQKQEEILKLIEACSGLHLEAFTTEPYVAQGDSLRVSITANNRLGIDISSAEAGFRDSIYRFQPLAANKNITVTANCLISPDEKITQPYWLEQDMLRGSFNVSDQEMIGRAQNEPMKVRFGMEISGVHFDFEKPLFYKHTDPVKGELYQPFYIVPGITLSVSPALTVVSPGQSKSKPLTFSYRLFTSGSRISKACDVYEQLSVLQKGARYTTAKIYDRIKSPARQKGYSFLEEQVLADKDGKFYQSITEIDYDHIPSIRYFRKTKQRVLVADIKTRGTKIGYITGAGDKVPEALEQMGYSVTILHESDIKMVRLREFDAVVTGVRAYNINEWLSGAYPVLMQYVQEGGVMLVQYNTNSSLGPVKAPIGPYPFTIGRNRVTDENASVSFLLPADPVLQEPNNITENDFMNWIQERSIYHAENIDSHYRRILSMKDPGENEQEGSLLVADYGKGRFVYTGLVFFRELPAGVGGAYRLLANLLAAKMKR